MGERESPWCAGENPGVSQCVRGVEVDHCGLQVWLCQPRLHEWRSLRGREGRVAAGPSTYPEPPPAVAAAAQALLDVAARRGGDGRQEVIRAWREGRAEITKFG